MKSNLNWRVVEPLSLGESTSFNCFDWLDALDIAGLLYHPDDLAVDITWTNGTVLTEAEIALFDSNMNVCHEILEDELYDYSLELANHTDRENDHTSEEAILEQFQSGQRLDKIRAKSRAKVE